jgi:hypothetical protein
MRCKYTVSILVLRTNDSMTMTRSTNFVVYYHKLSLHVSGIYMPIFWGTSCMLLHMVLSTVKEN